MSRSEGAGSTEHDALKLALASHYRIDRELGRGGFATVFLAHDLRHDRPVALKVLHPDIAASLGSDRFKREIRLAARLQHPHVLGVHDSGETGHQLWFTMPFVEGESLRDRLTRERQLPVDDAIRIAREAADALDYAHRHGVVHRDIKPENILLTESHALVADFGIARALRAETLTQTGVFVGTPGYMSPEQTTASSTVDGRTDIYALGCVLYEMLAGEPPFTGPTPQMVMARVMTGDARPVRAARPAVPAALEAIIARAMARVPADRFTSAAEFGAALTQVAGELRTPPAAAVTPPVAGAHPRRQVRTAFLMAVGVVLLLSAAVVTYFNWSRGQRNPDYTTRLAVLPFENLGAADDDYFADGIADDLRGKLAALDGLQVIARASAIQYKKTTTKTPQQIGQELDVDYLLTGTVRWEREGQGNVRRVRVSPELIQASNGTTRWQQPFDTELHDVFQVQADIAERVARALDVELGAGMQRRLAARRTSNVDAYDAYLRGEQLSQSGDQSDPASLRKATGYYEKAVALDPSFAQAWAQLSRAACGIARVMRTPQEVDQCRSAAERALVLGADTPEARLAMATYFRNVAGDLDRALEQLALGLHVAPNNADLLAASGRTERELGHRESALAHLQQAERMNPRSVAAVAALARTYHDLHRYDEATAAYDRALTLAPTNLSVIQGKARVALSRGDLNGARRVIRTALDSVDAKTLVVYFATFEEMMWVLPDDLRTRVVDLQPEDFANDRAMWALKVAATHRLMGNATRAREYGASAAAAYQPIARRYPDDPQQQELFGRALALAGRCGDAVSAGERSLAARGASLDPYVRYQVARIYIQCGQYDRALDLIERIIAGPGQFTPAWLQIDPIFTPLKGNPRFERLLQRKQ
jgi:serine/threonine-protein kinase